MSRPFSILVLGSSGTAGAGLGRGQAWPAKLQAALDEAGRPTAVANYAMAGLPIAAYAERLLLLADSLKPDFCLLQLAIPNRHYIGINGQQKVVEASLPRWQIFGMAGPNTPERGPATTRLMLSPNISSEDSPFYPLMLRYHLSKVERNASAEDAADYLRLLRFWDRNIATADLTYVQHAKEVLFLQWMLERMSLRYGMFDWRDGNVVLDPRGNPFHLSLNRRTFIGEGQETCFEFIQRTAPDQFSDWQLDDWGHLTELGHDYIARRFILPWLLPRVSNPVEDHG